LYIVPDLGKQTCGHADWFVSGGKTPYREVEDLLRC